MSRPPLLTARQVAELLGLSVESVLRWHRAGRLPGFRLANGVLRFDPDEIDAWLNHHREETPPCPTSPAP